MGCMATNEGVHTLPISVLYLAKCVQDPFCPSMLMSALIKCYFNGPNFSDGQNIGTCEQPLINIRTTRVSEVVWLTYSFVYKQFKWWFQCLFCSVHLYTDTEDK